MADPQQNPQQAVDDALATPATPSMASLPLQPTTTLESPAPLSPPPSLSEAPVEPPAPVAPAESVTPPVEPVAPVVTTTTTTTNVPMGDETPLAFAAQAPSTPTTPPPTTTTTTTTLAEPVYVPPAQDVPKPKTGSKIMMTLLGIFALLATLAVGGYYAYLQFGGETATVAVIEQSACHGCKNGGWLVWRDGRCRVTGICDSGVPGKDTENPNPTAAPDNIGCTNLDPVTKECKDAGCSGLASDNYAFCGGCVNKCVSKAALAPFGGCRDYVSNKCGTAAVTGSSCSLSSNAEFFKTCTCDGATIHFNTTGSCESRTGTNVNPDGTVGQSDGLCEVYRRDKSCPGGAADPSLGTSPLYNCNSNGCSLTPAGITAGYKVQKWRCNRITNLGSGCQDGTPATGNSQTFSANCGSEQIDVQNGAVTVDFRSRINTTVCGTTTSEGPTLVCNSLTKNKADAAITLGSPITLTCAGTVTPASAGTLSYQFRYMTGTGAWQNLANTTTNTATLTPTQCGVQYTAQCRACATLNGVKQCDPVWQGVAP